MKLMITDNRGKIPILFLNPWAAFYGPETSLYLIIKYLNGEIFQPVVVLPDEGPLQEKLQTLDVPVSVSPLLPWFWNDGSASGALSWLADLPARVQRLVDIVHQRDIKIIHSNVADLLEGALAARVTGRPHICTVRSKFFTYTWRKGYIPVQSALDMLNSLSHTIVPNSSAVKEAISPFVAPTKLRVIYTGIETQSFQAYPIHDSPDSVLAQAQNTREPRISSIGRVAEEKGYDLLIDAAALVVGEYPSARFSVFGPVQNEQYYRWLLQQVGRLNLEDVFHFEGHTDDAKDQLTATDLLVVSSKSEGGPLVVLEAMAAGKPVVSTRCGGPEEFILDGTTGYLVPLGDPRALADAIIRVLRDPEQARIMGQKGLERVRQHFDIRYTAEQYEALYRDVLESEEDIQPTADGAAAIGRIFLAMVEQYGEELSEMGSRFQELKHFEASVKNSWAYRGYRGIKDLATIWQ